MATTTLPKCLATCLFGSWLIVWSGVIGFCREDDDDPPTEFSSGIRLLGIDDSLFEENDPYSAPALTTGFFHSGDASRTAPSPSASATPPKPAPPIFPGPKTLPPTGPWKLLFFENDFSYKKDPQHSWLLGEDLKDLQFECLESPLTISTGGEIRHRYMHEDNRLRPGGPVHADYNLWRWRHYVDACWGDLRIYGEGIEADSFGSTAPDQAIDVNRWDLLNLFVDYTFLRDAQGTHTLRYGRQELVFGRQRLVSPLDWANTRRNFEGARYMLRGQD